MRGKPFSAGVVALVLTLGGSFGKTDKEIATLTGMPITSVSSIRRRASDPRCPHCGQRVDVGGCDVLDVNGAPMHPPATAGAVACWTP